MGYRSEVSIIVGKKIKTKINALVKKCEKMANEKKIPDYDLENLKDFLATATPSKNGGTFTKYYHTWMKWYTDIEEDGYHCLTMFENLIKDCAYSVPKDETFACSFARIGEDTTDIEMLDNWGLQEVSIKCDIDF